MKRIVTLCLAVLLCGLLAVPVCATASYVTANDLYESWDGNFPDYVSGVWVENNDSYPLYIGITDDAAGEQGKELILSRIADDDSVRFVVQKYSYNELRTVQKALEAYMGGEYGPISLGVDVYRNCVEVGFHADCAESEETQRMIAEMTETYGDRISVEWMEGYIAYTLTLDQPGSAISGELACAGDVEVLRDANRGARTWRKVLLGTLIAVGLLGTVALIAARRPRRAAAQTAVGTITATLAVGRRPTRREIERAVADSDTTPPPELEDRILEKLDR